MKISMIIGFLLLVAGQAWAMSCHTDHRDIVISFSHDEPYLATVAYTYPCHRGECWEDWNVEFSHDHDAYSDEYEFFLPVGALYISVPRDGEMDTEGTIYIAHGREMKKEAVWCHPN
jgi:hypothetical protein